MSSQFALVLTLLHSERPKLYTILAFLSAIGLKHILVNLCLVWHIEGVIEGVGTPPRQITPAVNKYVLSFTVGSLLKERICFLWSKTDN